MEAFLVSAAVVGLAEIGDKTQLLSLFLAARFRRPWPIIWGILVATLANHAAAGAAGALLGGLIEGAWLRWLLGLSFLVVAIWALIPDRYNDSDGADRRFGPFAATLCAFFVAEIGDKTQIATVGLAARFEELWPVVVGTTLGMMLANVPAVLIGDRIADRLPVRAIRIAAALVFAALGIWTLVAWS
jgi:putative Ca2+/H+ antiporter (TMEM165/GDT1 family)